MTEPRLMWALIGALVFAAVANAIIAIKHDVGGPGNVTAAVMCVVSIVLVLRKLP